MASGEGIFIPMGIQDEFTPAAHRMAGAGKMLQDMLEKMGKAAVAFGKDVALGEKATTSWGKAANKTIAGLKGIRDFNVGDLGKKFSGASVLGIGIGAAFAEGIKSGGQFEKEIIRLGFVGDITKQEIQQLSDGAKDLAANSEFGRNEFLKGEITLKKYGRTAKQALEDMGQAAKFASINDMTLNEAVDFGTKISLLYYKNLDQVGRAQDIMTKTALQANIPIAELSGVLESLGPIASGSNVSLEKAAAMFALMSKGGLGASEASSAVRLSMMRAQRAGVDYGDAIKLIKKQYDALKTPAEKAAKLVAEFGPRAAKLTTLFQQNAGALETMTKNMENAGGTVEALDAQFEKLSSEKKLARLNTQFRESVATLAGPMIKVLGFVVGGINKLGSGFRTVLVAGVALLSMSGALGYVYGGVSKLFPVFMKLFLFMGRQLLIIGRISAWFGTFGGAIMFVVGRVFLVVQALWGMYKIIQLLIMGVQELGIIFGKQGKDFLPKDMQARVAAMQRAGKMDSNGNLVRDKAGRASFTVGGAGATVKEKVTSITKETNSGLVVHGPVHIHLPAVSATQRDGLVDGLKSQLRGTGR